MTYVPSPAGLIEIIYKKQQEMIQKQHVLIITTNQSIKDLSVNGFISMTGVPLIASNP